MFNCVVIRVNNRPVMIVHTDLQADNIRRLLSAEGMPWHGMQVNCDWSYIDSLPF